jgi:MFS transporter, ACS family, glucarate transporter
LPRSEERTSPGAWLIAGILLVITTHAFATRFSMSVAAQRIQTESGLTNMQVGAILSAFILGYAVLQFPGGLLVDRFGPYRVLAVSIFGWSGFTLLTGLADWLWPAQLAAGLMVARLLSGAAQASVLTCAIKAISRWLPAHRRATGNGVAMMGLGIGGAVSPSLMVWLMSGRSWTFPFFVLGFTGLVLGCVWLVFGQERAPVDGQPSRGTSVPWRNWAGSRSVWALVLSYGVAGYTSYVIFTWFFLYLVNVRHMSLASGGLWAGLPYVAVTVGTLAGGRLCDALSARFGKRTGRLSVVLMGEGVAALLIPIGGRVDDAHAAVVLISLATGFHLLGQTASWAAAVDLAPIRSGLLFGLMNTMAQIAGVIAPVATPAIAGRFGWVNALDFSAVMVFLAGLLWCAVDPGKALIENGQHTARTAA